MDITKSPPFPYSQSPVYLPTYTELLGVHADSTYLRLCLTLPFLLYYNQLPMSQILPTYPSQLVRLCTSELRIDSSNTTSKGRKSTLSSEGVKSHFKSISSFVLKKFVLGYTAFILK